jgi:hypothetical protein
MFGSLGRYDVAAVNPACNSRGVPKDENAPVTQNARSKMHLIRESGYLDDQGSLIKRF